MRPRRSRFTRIYHRVTRGSTRSQWKQISQLRPHGSLGHPAQTASRAQAHVYTDRVVEATFVPPADDFSFEPAALQFADENGSRAAHATQNEGGIGVALLTTALFLLACAYAAFSGYMHSHSDRFAWLGLAGALAALAAAGVGICLAAAPARRHYSGRFLAVSAVFLASLLGVLLFVSAGH